MNSRKGHGRSGGFLDMAEKIFAWWGIGWKAWTCLGAGYAWVFVSLAMRFEEPSSGAVLISFCVVAEIFYSSENWLSISNKAITITDEPSNLEEINKLRPFAFPYKEFDNSDWCWKTHEVRDYVQIRIQWAIALSAVLGSILWGYGHLIFD